VALAPRHESVSPCRRRNQLLRADSGH
jgi:hypothetical protein